MRRMITSLMLTGLVMSSAAWAQDSYTGTTESNVDLSSTDQQAGTVGEYTGGTTTAESAQVEKGFSKEVVGVKPSAGVIVFHDATGNTTSRGTAGLQLDFNPAALSNFMGNSQWFSGITTGAFYSHIGSANTGFFGSSSDNATTQSPGANTLIIPANLKLGYTFSDAMRVAAHGGGNLTYRSIGQSMDFGPSTATSGSVWRIYPNVGFDVELGLTRQVSLLIRPDYTFTPGNNMFMGTVGVGIALG